MSEEVHGCMQHGVGFLARGTDPHARWSSWLRIDKTHQILRAVGAGVLSLFNQILTHIVKRDRELGFSDKMELGALGGYARSLPAPRFRISAEDEHVRLPLCDRRGTR